MLSANFSFHITKYCIFFTKIEVIDVDLLKIANWTLWLDKFVCLCEFFTQIYDDIKRIKFLLNVCFPSLEYFFLCRSNFLSTKFTVYDAQPPHTESAFLKNRSSSLMGSRQVSPIVVVRSYPVDRIAYELNVLGSRWDTLISSPRSWELIMYIFKIWIHVWSAFGFNCCTFIVVPFLAFGFNWMSYIFLEHRFSSV